MVYDQARGKVILFGGCDYRWITRQDTWEWDGSRGVWTDRTAAWWVLPGARRGHGMAYDSARARVVLFGGLDSWEGAALQDTWEWEGTAGRWTARTPGQSPTGRYGHAVAYDNARAKVVLFGGMDGYHGSLLRDTWEWDGTAGTWTDRTPAGARPSARLGHSMVYDASRGRVVMFGCCDQQWRPDTWEWDGGSGTWTDRTPAGSSPVNASNGAMVYDDSRGKVFLHGGFAGSEPQITWEWDGVTGTWTPVATAGDQPGGRMHHGMAYDTQRRKAVVFGGQMGGWLGDTWEWDAGAGGRPGTTAQVSFLSMGVSMATVTSIAATFYVGGVGYPAGATTPGAELLLWDQGVWNVVGRNTNHADNPGIVEWTTADPWVIGRLVRDPEFVLNLAVRPVEVSGTGEGRVSVDYLEVNVGYSLP
jgi:hypothetical protein